MTDRRQNAKGRAEVEDPEDQKSLGRRWPGGDGDSEDGGQRRAAMKTEF